MGDFMQNLMDTMNKVAKDERGRYHITLGVLIEMLALQPEGYTCEIDTGGTVTNAHSYRGYYSDLALAKSEGTRKCSHLLAELEDIMGKKLEGYKGGMFPMEHDTPVWISEYGVASGQAVIGIVVDDEEKKIVLETRYVH